MEDCYSVYHNPWSKRFEATLNLDVLDVFQEGFQNKDSVPRAGSLLREWRPCREKDEVGFRVDEGQDSEVGYLIPPSSAEEEH